MTGSVAASLLANNFHVGALRPYADMSGRIIQKVPVVVNGRPLVTNNGKLRMEKQQITGNADSTLRKNEWQLLDLAVLKAAKPRLRAVGDIEGAGLTFDIPNGFSKTVLQYQSQSDISRATFSMNGLRETDRDRPVYDLVNLPLPICHKDFSIDSRDLSISRNGSTPLDTSMATLAGRRVAEEIECLALGALSTYTYGGGSIYGYTNFTSRLTKTLTKPTATGWTPGVTINEVLAMITQSRLAFHYGPWMLYCGPNWDTYMDDDYSTAKGDKTLRQRLAAIEDIQGVRTLDYLGRTISTTSEIGTDAPSATDFPLVLVQMTEDVVRMVNGAELSTVMWETQGGFLLNFKVFCIKVIQLRADHNGNTGIVHGS